MRSLAVAALLAAGTLITTTTAQAGETVEMPDGLQAVEVDDEAASEEDASRSEAPAAQGESRNSSPSDDGPSDDGPSDDGPSEHGEALMQGLESRLERQANQEDDGPDQVGQPPAQADRAAGEGEQLEIAPLDEVEQEQAEATPPNADRWKVPEAPAEQTPESAAPAQTAQNEQARQARAQPQDERQAQNERQPQNERQAQNDRKILDVDIPEAKTTTALPSASQLGADGGPGGSLIPEPDAQARSCPMEVDDVRVTLRDFDGAIAIQFITVDGDVAELQKRVEALADRYRASDDKLAEAGRIDTVRLDRGAQLVVRLDDDAPVEKLRARLEKRARKMRFEGRCPQAVTG